MNNLNPIMKDALTGFAPPDATETKEPAAVSMARRLLDEIASLEESRQRALESRDFWRAACEDRREQLLVKLIAEHTDWLDERGAELYREWCDDQKGEAMIARAESRAFDREVL